MQQYLLTPSSDTYNPDPDYLRTLIKRTGLSHRATAQLLGLGYSTLRDYLNSNHASKSPYPVQFCLEVLAQYQACFQIEFIPDASTEAKHKFLISIQNTFQPEEIEYCAIDHLGNSAFHDSAIPPNNYKRVIVSFHHPVSINELISLEDENEPIVSGYSAVPNSR